MTETDVAWSVRGQILLRVAGEVKQVLVRRSRELDGHLAWSRLCNVCIVSLLDCILSRHLKASPCSIVGLIAPFFPPCEEYVLLLSCDLTRVSGCSVYLQVLFEVNVVLL